MRVKTICLEKDSFGIPSEKHSSLLPAGSQECRRNSAVYALQIDDTKSYIRQQTLAQRM